MSTTGKQGQGSDRNQDEWQQDLNPNPSEVGYQLWNRLIGVQNPERLT